jgi:hypothetical protein
MIPATESATIARRSAFTTFTVPQRGRWAPGRLPMPGLPGDHDG